MEVAFNIDYFLKCQLDPNFLSNYQHFAEPLSQWFGGLRQNEGPPPDFENYFKYQHSFASYQRIGEALRGFL